MAENDVTTTEPEAANAALEDHPVADAAAEAQNTPAGETQEPHVEGGGEVLTETPASNENPDAAGVVRPSSAARLQVREGHEPAQQTVTFDPVPTAPVRETWLDIDRVTPAGDEEAAKVKFLGQSEPAPLPLGGADGKLRTAEDVFSGDAKA